MYDLYDFSSRKTVQMGIKKGSCKISTAKMSIKWGNSKHKKAAPPKSDAARKEEVCNTTAFECKKKKMNSA